MVCSFVFSFALLLTICCVRFASFEQRVAYCPSCLRQKRILAIRGQILTKLGLTEESSEDADPANVTQEVLDTFNAAVQERELEFDAQEAADLAAEQLDQEEYFAKEIVRLPLIETHAATVKIVGLSIVPVDTYLLKFNTSTLTSDGNQISKAQLRLHVRPTSPSQKSADVRLEVCGIKGSSTNRSLGQGCSDILDWKRTSDGEARWISLDVTTLAQTWCAQKNANGEIKVIVRRGDEAIAPGSAVTLDGGQRFGYLAHVLAWVMPHKRTETAKRRRRRALDWEFCKSRPKERRCCLRSLYIDFRKDLNWKWIHAPAGFHANYCAGSCPFMWGTGNKHHTTVMALYSSKSPDAQGDPCCVAKRYKPLVILHYKGGKPKIEELNNMVVSRCACL